MEPIRKTVRVPCAPDEAFRVFTADIDRWWPKDRNSLSAGEGKVARAVRLEPREGGALTEIAHDGTAHHWGSVRDWSPPDRLVIAWHINAPEAEATTVEVTFRPEAEGTHVSLVHSGWERAREPAARDSYDAGWVHVFEERFADACRVTA